MPDKDYSIIQRILAGEKKAYAELVDKHKDRAMTLAMRMLKNHQDAEEALQDAFIRAFHALPKFERKSSFSTWFYRIVYNVCATALSRREQSIHVSIEQQNEDERFIELPSEDAQPDAEYESREFEEILYEEIEKLPAHYSSLFTLFIVQNMSYEQIVEVTGLPLGTVKARLFRARMMLKEAIVERLGSISHVFG
ncbi:MAG: sigma-70 family RNA polymerase sigma factor [bacterium]